MLDLTQEIRDEIYTKDSLGDFVMHKNSSTGVSRMLCGSRLSAVSQQVRQEHLLNNDFLIRTVPITKYHVTLDLDLFDIENSEGSSWMALFDFPIEATTLTIDVNITTPCFSSILPSTCNDGYEAIIERLTAALSDCTSLANCAITLNVFEPEPWFLAHQQQDFHSFLDINLPFWMTCPFSVLMIKCKDLKTPTIPQDMRPDASVSRFPGLLRYDDEDLYGALQRCITSSKSKVVAVLRAIEEYGEHLAQVDPNASLW